MTVRIDAMLRVLAHKDIVRNIDTQLIMISTDRLAHYWIELNHVNFFERVNLDDLTPCP
jgi:hypothetical protein